MEKQTKRFRRSFSTARVSPEVAARNGRITTQAFLSLGGSQAAVSYLNTHDQQLGGRPLDIAGESADGFDKVAAALTVRSLACHADPVL